jgi:hypothetical protein
VVTLSVGAAALGGRSTLFEPMIAMGCTCFSVEGMCQQQQDAKSVEVAAVVEYVLAPWVVSIMSGTAGI